MKRTTITLSIIAALALAAVAPSCILDEKIIDIIVKSEAYWDFTQDSASEVFTDTDSVEIGSVVDEALASSGYTLSDVDTATVVGGAYGVLEFSHTHDWDISGAIEIERLGGATDTIIAYDTQSVQDALGQRIPAPLTPEGLAILQQALDDYRAGVTPVVLKFRVLNGNVDPDPTLADRIRFRWRAWVTMQVVLKEGVELPDPF